MKRLSDLQDEIVRAIYRLAVDLVYKRSSPTAASPDERGGRRRLRARTLAQRSASILFLLPYKQTPWGERRRIHPHPMGPRPQSRPRHPQPRRVHPHARNDLTVRTAVLDARFICGDERLASTPTSA
jgi:[protein-PII] uridylyltransferase